MGHLKSRKSNKKNNALFLIRIKNISQLELACYSTFSFRVCTYEIKEVVGYPVTPIFLVKNTTFPGILLLKDGY